MPKPIDTTIRGAVPFQTLAAEVLELVARAHAARNSGRGMPGLPTGLKALDEALGGLQPGLHILGAEPGAGKTALALTIARHAVTKHGLPVVYASFDEVPPRLALKVIAACARLSLSDMANGRTPLEDVETAVLQYQSALAPLSFVAADAQLTVPDLIGQLRDQLKHHDADIGLLVVDYLQPWAAAQAAKGVDYRMAVGAMALELRSLANKTDCPVLLISAQNRNGQGTTSMTSLRESSDLEYGADSILLLTDDKEPPLLGAGCYARKLTLAKNRFGPNGREIALLLDGRIQDIKERA